MNKAILSALSAVAMICAAPASADFYNFKYIDKNGKLIASGDLTTENGAHYFDLEDHWYAKTIIAMTGSFMGEDISFYTNPYAPSLYQVGKYIFDNQLLLNAPTVLDGGGILISTPNLGPMNILGITDPGYPNPYLVLNAGFMLEGVFSVTAAAAPPAPLPGGGQADPTPLPTGTVTGIAGQIGPGSNQQFYSFDWQGGLFSATASMSGATPDQAFQFMLAGMGMPAMTTKLLDENYFMGTLAATLAPGRYSIGLFGVVREDPAFTIRFDTPVSSAVPEPAAWLLLLLGAGATGGMVRRRRRTGPSVAYA